MTANELREKYLKFFEERGHKIIPPAPLVPENDPTALFISAGMQPLVPYLLGQSHPEGKCLVDVQKCLRTDDINEVGDKTHHTFFEMLGNWSLGDYFKQKAIELSYEFLTSPKWLNINKDRLAISVFAGDKDASFDQESYNKWFSLGISPERIAKLPKKNNWWGPAGQTGPCGPDTEMFVWTGKGEAPEKFDPDNSDWVEVWNDVFMEYNKTADGKYEQLQQKNVDTGMGLERMLAVKDGTDDNYQTDLFKGAIQLIQKYSGKEYQDNAPSFRIIADHIRAAVFLIADGTEPSNKLQGYVLRRLIRRAIVKVSLLNITETNDLIRDLIIFYITTMSSYYPELLINQVKIITTIETETNKFNQTLIRGFKEFHRTADPLIKQKKEQKLPFLYIPGVFAFHLYDTYGFPPELTDEMAKEANLSGIKWEDYESELRKHQELSRTASAGMFKGGLQDHSEITTKYHTTTHLLHAALRQILGTHVQQKGSNITAERMRFDFSHPEKLTDEQLKEVENLVNEKINEHLPVTREEMNKEEALNSGALGFFVEKYGDRVSVYTIGDPSIPSGHSGSLFSREICGGPHVENTGNLGTFQIIKEESAGAGVRRIYATLS